MSEDLKQLHLLGATGKSRTEMFDGREHLVVPVIALTEGVIHAVNAEDAELVTKEFLAATAHTWNGRPCVVGHPTQDGRQISANDPAILQKQGFGFLSAARTNNGRMGMEAWADVKKLESLGQHAMLARLRAGDPIEVSVGALVQTKDGAGTHLGKPYKATWASGAGDHLAFLPNGRGACSVEMGCGSGRIAEMRTAEDFEAAFPDGKKPEGLVTRKSLRERLSAFLKAAGMRDAADDELPEFDQETAFWANADELKALVGKQISAKNMKTIQAAHDASHDMHAHTVELGADCNGMRLLSDGTAVNPPNKQLRAACGCEHKETDMTKEARIAALLTNEHNPLKDQKGLEAASDDALKALEAHCASATTLKAAADKKTADDKAAADLKAAELKAAQEKAQTVEQQLKALSEKTLTNDEILKASPKIAAIVAQHEAREASEKAALVTALEATKVLPKEQLEKKSLDELKTLAAFARVEAPDYSGRAMPEMRDAETSDVFSNPPNPYGEDALKAHRAAQARN